MTDQQLKKLTTSISFVSIFIGSVILFVFSFSTLNTIKEGEFLLILRWFSAGVMLASFFTILTSN